MTSSKSTAVDDDIISHVASQSEVSKEEVLDGLTASGGPKKYVSDVVSECYQLQSFRNELEPEIKEAARDDSFKLLDSDGYVFWVDQYDGFGAYIHAGDGDTYYVSLSQLVDDFSLVTEE